MRILFVTQWFHPEPSFKGLPFARALIARGHRVTVLTGFPNYPGGKVYAGYTIRLWQREMIEGVPVLRVALYPSHDCSAWGRVANYASFAVSASTVGLAICGPCDVAYIYHPPATIGLPMLGLLWIRRVPCVYDTNDLWPDTLAATGMIRNRWLLLAAGAWCHLVYAFASRVVVVSPGFRRRLITRGVPAQKVDLIYNWSPDAGGSAAAGGLREREMELLTGRFNILFAGNMGPAQALSTVIKAAREIQTRAPEVQFIIVGDGIEAEALRIKSQDLSNVIFLPRRPAADMPAVYAAVGVLLVHLKEDPLFEITIPSKTQTYLAAGKPIIAGLRGDGAELIRESRAGMVFPPEDSEALVASVLRMAALSQNELAEMGRNGRAYYERHLAMEIGVRAYERQLESVSQPSPPPIL